MCGLVKGTHPAHNTESQEAVTVVEEEHRAINVTPLYRRDQRMSVSLLYVRYSLEDLARNVMNCACSPTHAKSCMCAMKCNAWRCKNQKGSEHIWAYHFPSAWSVSTNTTHAAGPYGQPCQTMERKKEIHLHQNNWDWLCTSGRRRNSRGMFSTQACLRSPRPRPHAAS